jgi:hypothetical protein
MCVVLHRAANPRSQSTAFALAFILPLSFITTRSSHRSRYAEETRAIEHVAVGSMASLAGEVAFDIIGPALRSEASSSASRNRALLPKQERRGEIRPTKPDAGVW